MATLAALEVDQSKDGVRELLMWKLQRTINLAESLHRYLCICAPAHSSDHLLA